MKYLKLLFGIPFVYFYFAFSATTLTSCTKNNTDTVIVKHDSIIYIHDTARLTDTVYDLTSGLVGYYNFNGGNLNDSSGYNNNINFNNATPTTDRNGVANNAYLFNGSSSYMTVQNSASLNPNSITLYAIFKVNGYYAVPFAHGNFILCKDWDQANGMYDLQFSDFKSSLTSPPDTAHEEFLGAYGDNPGNTGALAAYDTSTYVTTGTWYKLAYTFDGIAAKLYINGNLIETSTGSTTFNPNSGDLYFGSNADPSGLYPFWFNGVIDEIRIYNRALSSKEIKSLANLP